MLLPRPPFLVRSLPSFLPLPLIFLFLFVLLLAAPAALFALALARSPHRLRPFVVVVVVCTTPASRANDHNRKHKEEGGRGGRGGAGADSLSWLAGGGTVYASLVTCSLLLPSCDDDDEGRMDRRARRNERLAGPALLLCLLF